MQFDDIFTAYYTQYRAEATAPESADDEYEIGMRLANEALRKWETYDNTYWNELYSTLQLADDGTKTITSGTTSYEAPSDMRDAGGQIAVRDSSGNTQQLYPIIQPNEVQFQGDQSVYAWFQGDQNNGYTLILNPAPPTSLNGMALDYPYYKKVTEFTQGSDISECPDSDYIVNRMLANRFRASRNPYYASARDEAENLLRIMQARNNAGTWANPWQLPDNSGSVFGSE